LPKDLCGENGILDIPIQLRRAATPRVVPFQFASNDSPTVSVAEQKVRLGRDGYTENLTNGVFAQSANLTGFSGHDSEALGGVGRRPLVLVGKHMISDD